MGKSQSLHFSVTGEYLTELTRTLVLEGEWEKAYRILSSGNEGKEEFVKSILLGDYRLDGENETIHATEDNNKEYKEELLRTFAGYTFFPKEKTWYKPYAFVNTIGEDSEYVKERALFYKEHKKDKHSFLKIGNKKVLVLFTKVKSILPPWMEDEYQKKGILKCVTEYIKYRNLCEVGVTEDQLLYSESQMKFLEEVMDYTHRNDYIPRIALIEEADIRTDMIYELNLKLLKDKIVNQETEWIELEDFRIPKTPFGLWAEKTHNILISENLKPWQTICPRGMKMQQDDPLHSDWVLGAGVDPEKFYRSDFEEKVLDFLFKSSYRKMIVLNGKGFHKGIVTKDINKVTKDHILVIPHAGVEFFEAAKKAKAVISAMGGPAAHLVLNAKDENIPLCLIQNAETKFSEGEELEISLDLGSWICPKE